MACGHPIYDCFDIHARSDDARSREVVTVITDKIPQAAIEGRPWGAWGHARVDAWIVYLVIDAANGPAALGEGNGRGSNLILVIRLLAATVWTVFIIRLKQCRDFFKSGS